MFIKKIFRKYLLFSAFHHSNLQTSSTILDFRSKIHYYENNYSRMLPPINNLEKMSPSDISANRIASVFLGNPTQMELNRGKIGGNKNLEVNIASLHYCIIFFYYYLNDIPFIIVNKIVVSAF